MNKNLSLFLFVLIFLPVAVFAAPFERDLYFGMRNDADVRELQSFLKEQGAYSEEITGNFFVITKDAVMRFQEKEGIAPAAGYFGPKTRSVVNQKLGVLPQSKDSSELVKFLKKRIIELQKELEAFREQQKKELEVVSPVPIPEPPSAATTTTLSPPPAMESTTTPVIAKGVKFSGESTTTFPITAVLTAPLKIGDIVIRNDTSEPLLFSQLIFDIYDTMNSTLNRGRQITLFLRQGTTTPDTLISKTNFTFNTSPPPTLDGVHRYQLNTEYPILFAAGETKSIGFWVENLEYVISGTLKFALYDIQTSRAVNRIGGFSFLLTR